MMKLLYGENEVFNPSIYCVFCFGTINPIGTTVKEIGLTKTKVFKLKWRNALTDQITFYSIGSKFT